MGSKAKNAITMALNILKDIHSEIGIDVTGALDRLSKAIQLLDSDEITIALLGSVSDGKTTTISGLLGRTMENMKIATNESSDEIAIYETDFLGKHFRIVDTPGLFGSREKTNSSGKTVRFSQITEDYISQANFVIYVTEVSNPLPLGHHDELRHIMRDLRKLGNAIFVINKMDKKYDVEDDEDFEEGATVKTEFLRKKLKDCLDLTSDELESLNIICLAAKPENVKYPTIEDWLKKPDMYRALSRIDILKESVKKYVGTTDSEEINLKTALDTAIDAIEVANESIEVAKLPIKRTVKEMTPLIRDMRDSLENTEFSINSSKEIMIRNLDNLEKDLRQTISSASVETINNIIINEIGCKENEVDFSIVLRKINRELSKCEGTSLESLKKTADIMFRNETLMEEMAKDALNQGLDYAKNIKISPETVGKIRDYAFKNFKFKPYGKIKMANKINNVIKGVMAGITALIEVYDWFKAHKAQKQLQEAKQALLEIITDIFNNVNQLFATKEEFLKNFANVLIQMQNDVKEKEMEIELLKEKIATLVDYQTRMRRWKECAEDVEFTNI